MTSRLSRLSRLCFVVAALVVTVSLAASLVWALGTLAARPLDGVEGDVLFEADRISRGLALYTAPTIGVLDYGPPPARFLVLYPPLWSALLSVVPPGASSASVLVARVLALASWIAVLAWPVLRAPRPRRLAAGAMAAFVGSIWVLALYGASGRPDALAVLLAGVALERAARRGDVDVLGGVLFALAVWVKPNVVGAAPGAIVCAFVMRRRPGGFLAAVATSAVVAGVLTFASGGRWLEHLLASTGQPPSLPLLLEQLAGRGPFFLLPIALSLACGWRARRDPGARIATAALATSTVWSLLCLAKIGSAANYFLEPMVCAVIVLARADVPPLGERARLALGVGSVVQALWTGMASVKSAARELPMAYARDRVLARTRATCGATTRSVVLADEPGLERQLNGRIVATPFQSTHLARRGRFPVDAWISDVASPEAACLVMQDDLLERPLAQVDVAHDRFGVELRRALRARFELVEVAGGYRIYRARDKDGGPR